MFCLLLVSAGPWVGSLHGYKIAVPRSVVTMSSIGVWFLLVCFFISEENGFEKPSTYHWSESHHMFIPSPIIGKGGENIMMGLDQS